MSGKTSKLRRMHEKQKRLSDKITGLQAEVTVERVTRVSAQRGLVAYMKQNGLGHRIGYDPDNDPKLNLLRPRNAAHNDQNP